jgi:hypothetical protein
MNPLAILAGLGGFGVGYLGEKERLKEKETGKMQSFGDALLKLSATSLKPEEVKPMGEALKGVYDVKGDISNLTKIGETIAKGAVATRVGQLKQDLMTQISEGWTDLPSLIKSAPLLAEKYKAPLQEIHNVIDTLTTEHEKTIAGVPATSMAFEGTPIIPTPHLTEVPTLETPGELPPGAAELPPYTPKLRYEPSAIFTGISPLTTPEIPETRITEKELIAPESKTIRDIAEIQKRFGISPREYFGITTKPEDQVVPEEVFDAVKMPELKGKGLTYRQLKEAGIDLQPPVKEPTPPMFVEKAISATTEQKFKWNPETKDYDIPFGKPYPKYKPETGEGSKTEKERRKERVAAVKAYQSEINGLQKWYSSASSKEGADIDAINKEYQRRLNDIVYRYKDLIRLTPYQTGTQGPQGPQGTTPGITKEQAIQELKNRGLIP